MLLLILAIATAINIIFIFSKIKKKRFEDAMFDGAILITLSFLFGQTLGGLSIATVASCIISIYLYIYPPDFIKDIKKWLK